MGNYVIIDYGSGITVRAMHMYDGTIEVSEGDTVEEGQVLGKMGNSGNSTGTHLHVDMTINGEFVDISEYLSEGSNITQSSSGISMTEDKIFYIGDSTMEGLNAYGVSKSPSSYFYAVNGISANYVINNYSKLNIPQDSSCIVVELGANGLYLGSVNWKNTQELVDKLVQDYSNKQIFVVQVEHVGEGYADPEDFNSKLDEYNRHMREYCQNKEGVTYINPTTNVVANQGNGYLKDEYSAADSLHFNVAGYEIWYEDLIKCIKQHIRLGTAQSPIDMSKNIIEREKGNPNSGYKINIDLNAEVDNLLRQLQDRGYHLENYLSSKNQKAYLKNMIKAVIVTQYPDLRNANDIANEESISDDEVQGCIKIKRYADGETKAFASGSLTNPRDKNDLNDGMYLAYMPYEDFMKMVSDANRNAFNYFTMDSSNNLVVAGWETMEVNVDGPKQTNVGEIQGNVQIGNAPSEYWPEYTPRQQPYTKLTTKSINYLSQVSNYMMPFNLMWTLLVYGHNDKFIDDIARLVISTKIVIGCFDATNVRVTSIPQSFSMRGEAVINANLYDPTQQHYNSAATSQEAFETQVVYYKFEVTETDILKTDTPSLNVIYADSWTAVYNKDYKLKTETKQEDGEIVKLDDEILGRDTLMKRGEHYVGDREPDNEALKKKIDETIDSEKEKILNDAILKQQQAADAENAKISYKYEVLREKLQANYVGNLLTFMMAEKDVQSHMINMITNKTIESGINAVFNTENDLMVKYAKKYGNPATLIEDTASAIEFLQGDEDFYNKLTRNGNDKTQARVYETNIESITIETKKIKADREETVNQEITTTTVAEVPSNGNVRWKSDKNARENSFVKILSYNSEAKTNLHGVSGWFFESMEHTAAIADLLDLMKMLFQFVYEGLDYGIEPNELLDLFDPEKMQNMNSTSGTSTLVGEGTEAIYNYLIGNGFTNAGAAGAMGNIEAESGFLADSVESWFLYGEEYRKEYTRKVDNKEISKNDFVYNGPNGNGYGLVGFTWPALKQELYENTVEKGRSIADVEGQLETIISWISKYCPDLYSTLTTSNDLYTCTYKFLTDYERPAYPNIDDRYAYAQKYYK